MRLLGFGKGFSVIIFDGREVKSLFLLLTCLVATSFAIKSAAMEDEQEQKILNKVALDQSGTWYFSNSIHSSFAKLGSNDAQEGRHLLEIDSGSFTFPYKLESEVNGYFISPEPRGFLFQTILADGFIGKHLHISAFAKSVKPNFEEIKKSYQEWFLEEQKAALNELSNSENKEQLESLEGDQLEIELNQFERFINQSRATSNYGVSVLLHFKEDEKGRSRVALHAPTSVGAPKGDGLWDRFNVELGVPENCQAISIVLWSKGLSIVQYDYVAIVPHGDAVSSRPYRFELYEHEDMYQAVTPLLDGLDTRFKNLSFEE